MNYCFRFSLLIGLLAMILLAAPLTAQEEGPAPVGLRPDAPTYALHGPHWVGHAVQTIDDGNERPLEVSIWYPALNPDGLGEEITYTLPYIDVTFTGKALQEVAPDLDGGPYPLMILAHGLGVSRFHVGHLGEHMASYGFVVIATDYQDHLAAQSEMYTSFITRPADVSRQIDYAVALMEDGGDWVGLIDTEKIGVVGHSFGGLTALSAAGGQLNWDAYSEWCEVNGETEPIPVCQMALPHLDDMAALAGLDEVPEGLWPSPGDDRINTIVALSPAGRFIGAQGVANIDVPVLMVTGTSDTIAIPEDNFYPVYEALPGRKLAVEFEGANHMFPSVTCDNAPWIAEWGYYGVCSDPVWDMDRAHDLTHHFVTAFLLDFFYGDMEAHASLLPENVNFSGISIETEGF